MGELPRVQPKSRKAWRHWLEKNHASSTGVWLVYAKKHTWLPSLTYNDAVEEALCFGWIDSKIHPIDDDLYISALNKTRVEWLVAAGLMTPAGLGLVQAAKKSATWDATKHVEELTFQPDLVKAIKANPDAARNWVSYSPSRRKGVLYRLAGAKRPETRAKYLQEIIENMARNMSHAERTERAGFRPKPTSSRPAKR